MNLHNAKIAVFGSAFNPPTLGHADVISRLSHFDLVLLVPSYAHAWQKKMASFERRVDWLRLFTEESAFSNTQICLEEKAIGHGEAITTWDLLSRLENVHPESELTFVMGPDNFNHFAQFYRYQDILSRWQVLTCNERVIIRSSQIRERLQKKQSISDLTTPKLAQHLMNMNNNPFE